MKKIILIRHAKSSWDTITDDLTRPISKRGIKDAHLVSDVLKEHLPNKSIIWTSPAKRAKETATIFCQNMDLSLECVIIREGLYTFEHSKLREEIKKCKNDHDALILFGHNDAITKFVNKFGSETFDNVPTSGVVVINFDTDDWGSIESGVTELTIFPRDLK
ncbi:MULTISPECIES: SixA phosphatase family protein [Myroides]|uniref:SixA phosphatase family protein n=1 Tax=Myroides TaxID=76831 RepID=UPI00130335A7|nr:histidine phosphatase family protein [Myroides phaeus]